MSLIKKDFAILNLYMHSGVDAFLHTMPQNRTVKQHDAMKINEYTSDKQYSVSLTAMNANDDVHRKHETNITLKSKDSKTQDRVATNKVVDQITNFHDLCNAIKTAEICEIKKTALNTVIYDGCIDAKIMAIGEAPGASEDEHGIPFCGQSGKLLDNILRSINLDRKKNLFITNSIFWRPPGNRRPTQEEIQACRPFLEKMISIINPKLIIMIGSTAVEALLDIKSVSMNYLRTQKYLYINQYMKLHVQAVTIFHPSYLLRQPMQKKSMWFDMIKIANMIKDEHEDKQ